MTHLPNTDNNLINCPQCGYPAEKVKFIIGGEETTSCPWCGYYSIANKEGTREMHGYGTMHFFGSNNSIRLNKNSVLNIKDTDTESVQSIYVWNPSEKRLDTFKGTKPQTLDEMVDESIAERDWENMRNYD